MLFTKTLMDPLLMVGELETKHNSRNKIQF